MRGQILAALLILIIFLLSGLVYVINLSNEVQEGFRVGLRSDRSAYDLLRNRLRNMMTPYCNLSSFIEDQMRTIYMTPKSLDNAATLMLERKKEAEKIRKSGGEPPIYSDDSYKSPGESEAEANAHIQRTYNDVYNCKDELAKFRPSTCKVVTMINATIVVPTESNDQHVPCSVYLDLPDYDPDDIESIAISFLEIPDNLAELLNKEIAWYNSVMDHLQNGLDAGANPPSHAPTGPNAPAPSGDVKSWNADGKPFEKPKKEGFANKCSSKAAKFRQKKKKADYEKESATCKIPSLSSEIKRVNRILDSDTLKNALAKSESMLARAMKLKSDLQKLKDGNLYGWQLVGSGPKKSYATFKGGDRSASFVASMEQNKGLEAP